MRFKTIIKKILVLIFICSSHYAKAQCGTFISTFPYTEGFESAPAWTSGGTNSDWAWGTPAHPTISSAGSGSKCWTVGGLSGSFYNYSELSWIMSPCFDFTTLNYPWISFKIFWEDEYKYDGMVLQYSLNSGTTWANVGAFGDPVNCLNDNWYNYSNVTWLTSASPKHGWTGRSGATSGSCQGGNGSLGWVTAKHCMSALAGQPNVRFRFLFGSGTTCNSYDGISIDDIFIDNAPSTTANFNHSCVTFNTLAFTSVVGGSCASSYSWNFNDPVSGSSNTSALANPTHVFSNPGTYNVNLTVNSPCGAPSTITMPVYILGGGAILNSPTCFGINNGTLTCTIFGGAVPNSYIWSTGDTIQTLTGLAPGAYSVTVSSGSSCPLTTTFSLPSPTQLLATTLATSVSCFGGSNGNASVTATGGTAGYTYSWAPSGGSSATAAGLAAGTYTVTVVDGNGCTTNTTAVINSPASAVAISINATPVSCFGGSNGVLNAIATGGTAGYLYNWTPSGSTSSSSLGLTAGSYTVVVTDALGCSNSASALVTQPSTALTATLNSTPSLCATNNGTATALASGGTLPYLYSWSPSGGTASSAIGLATGTYTLTVVDANGCTITPNTMIANSGSVTANLSSTSILCYGGTEGTATVSATGGTGPFSYLWNNGQTGATLSSLGAGNYCVSVTDSNGCQDNTCIDIFNPPQMNVDFSSDPSITDMSNPEIHFTDLSTGGMVWQWNFGDLNTSTIENPIHVYSQEGTYPVTLIVTNSLGCIDSVSHDIIINNGYAFFAPNAFTPGTNDLNDTFLPKGTNWDTSSFHLSIFDRWGNLIFQTSDANQGWNGRLKNSSKIAEMDVYVWKVQVSDTIGNPHYYIGSVSIIR
ncbi:hypothetical protein BH10BAC1_BH10BAC1_12030 [soil metagenome]